MELYRVYYSELVEYEEYIEANSEEQAIELFKGSLGEDTLEPINVTLEEIDVEQTRSYI